MLEFIKDFKVFLYCAINESYRLMEAGVASVILSGEAFSFSGANFKSEYPSYEKPFRILSLKLIYAKSSKPSTSDFAFICSLAS